MTSNTIDITKNITYFASPGEKNTKPCIDIAVKRAKELGITTFLIATTSGKTAEALADIVDPKENNIVAVTHMVGFKERGVDRMSDEVRKRLTKRGIDILTTTHSLSGVGRGINNKFGLLSPQELMAATLRLFGQGVKVCMEITIMAADAGLLPMDEEIVVIGGTKGGADTACIVTPAHSNEVFNFKYHEVLCKPRL
ncbi:MAG: pyruvate kinase alpha/beta domain-containing protein [Candidatus Methanofastidiosia archaeon]